ncbi:uncharacterized protein L969DRAFT_54914 [Mixia osmundae IAM 14324]|uniref:uncharacterized protein n=1 Tax=Mixia osmundae (strain CBS 9802 / IAM 14324 / JCM 22182 / KY 12970) TaxID=764103 RepID=UPI0004A55410|nr:uncharacterized protein L969DRAFT_54914 [Mixia osmundae IAM 14324]KEI36428.1 hypothetical protein L969DRAFT_54914 [Mixia osmundae IAM 14324]
MCRWLAVPVINFVTSDDPEKAHKLAVKVLASGLAPVDKVQDDDVLAIELWGKRFSNPVGIAAGFDKHAEAIDGLFGIGFGYVEIGSVTPQAQPGNPQPRMFRIPETQACVNRYGFNSDGHAAVIARLRARIRHFVHHNALSLPTNLLPPYEMAAGTVTVDAVSRLLASDNGRDAVLTDSLGMPRSLHEGKVLAINLGKNKTSEPDDVEDFLEGVHSLGPYADVLVINVSSPNTPGLRGLQRKGMLEELLESVVLARNDLKSKVKPPVLVKVAPDLSAQELGDVAKAVLDSGINGIIVSNTTISRPPSAGTDPRLAEVGGLSGPPLKSLAIQALATLYRKTEGKVPLIGCGGISTGQDALDYAQAGASFVQLYTALGYQGVGLPRIIKDELTALLRKRGTTWRQSIGTNVPAGVPEVDEELIALRREVEAALSDMAQSGAANAPQIPRKPKQRVEQPAIAEIILSTAPVGSQSPAQGALPTSGFTEVPVQVGKKHDLEEGQVKPELKSDKNETSSQELALPGEKGHGKGGLFSSFGSRASAGQSGKRLV